jgi:hypothetical protein
MRTFPLPNRVSVCDERASFIDPVRFQFSGAAFTGDRHVIMLVNAQVLLVKILYRMEGVVFAVLDFERLEVNKSFFEVSDFVENCAGDACFDGTEFSPCAVAIWIRLRNVEMHRLDFACRPSACPP